MDHFDPLTMQYLATPVSVPGPATHDYLPNQFLPLDGQEYASEYGDTYAGSDFGAASLPPQQPARLKRFSSTYEDPFSDVLSGYDPVALPDSSEPHTPSIDSNNKLLSFSQPIYNYALLDYSYQRTQVSISAQLHGMFFLAESPWGPTSDPTGPAVGPPAELTCYRRNLFQVSGSITLPRGLRYILTDQGDQIPIMGQELEISATESVEGNAVKIISVPWKTPAANTTATEEKMEKEPPPLPLDILNGQEMDPDYANFAISWKRLQFRIATANNGRRKELQQHFVVRLKLTATLSTGQKVSLCEAASGAIIVRGRSPRNFATRKEFPVGGSGSTSGRKSNHMTPTSRKASDDVVPTRATNQQLTDLSPTQEPNQIANYTFDNSNLHMPHEFLDWKASGAHDGGAMTALPPETFEMPHGLYAQSSPDLARPAVSQRPHLSPINLSLMDDEPKRPPTSNGHHKVIKKQTRSPSFSINPLNSPDESADLLYEYFPLGLDDWMPPVDAVYRPHVVHHINTGPDVKAEKMKTRSKRYFSEDHST